MNKQQKEMIKALNGAEFNYSDIGCVGINGLNIIHYGQVIETITSKNYQEVVDSYHESEYGTTDMEEIMVMEGF